MLLRTRALTIGGDICTMEKIVTFVQETAIKYGYDPDAYIRCLAEIYTMTYPASTLSDVEKAYEILK